MKNKNLIYLNEIPVCALKTKEIIKKIFCLLKTINKSEIITFVNAHVFCLSQNDKILTGILKESYINCIDGISIIYAVMILYKKIITRSIMTKVFDDFILNQNIPKVNALLIGLTDEEIQKAKDEINKISKNLKIIEAYSGYHNDNYYKDIFKKIKNIKIILIGASSPKSEYLCKIAKESITKKIIWHVGAGTLKCYAGTKKRAGKWFSFLGLEWLHRFIFEKHTRMRYLTHNFLFIVTIIKLLIKK